MFFFLDFQKKEFNVTYFACFYTRKSMKQAKKAHEAHENDIKQLQKELDDVERKREEFEEMCEQELQSQGKDLSLEDDQVIELH